MSGRLPRPEARWRVPEALEDVRLRALEIFEEWDRKRHADRLRRSRREAELRHRLTRAVYLENVREAAWRVEQLRYFLAERAASDGDLDIARRWLGEQAEAEEERREGARRSWRKLLLTGLPLAFALGLVVLLVAVLIWA